MQLSRWPVAMTSSRHVYEVRSRNDHRGVDLISDVLPFGWLWYDPPDNAIGYAMHRGRGVLEILVYAIFFLSVVSSIWQFAQTPLKISAHGVEENVACHTTTTPPFVRS